ncbi:MAG: YdgA family protein [Candidatus Sedimenticola endophacoides]
MKKFAALFVLLVALLLALPGYIGYQAEGRYKGLLEQSAQGELRLTGHSYRRGWFDSEAQTEFTIDLLPGPDGLDEAPQTLRLTVNSRIVHGPLLPSGGLGLAEIDSSLLLDDEPLFPADYPALIRTILEWDGAGSGLIDLPATVVEATARRPRIDFAGLHGRTRFAAGLDRVEVELEMAGIVAHGDADAIFGMGPLRIVSESQRDPSGLMLGTAHVEFDSITMNDGSETPVLVMRGGSADVENRAVGERVNGRLTYRLDSLEAGGDHFGPAELVITVENLSARALAELQQALEEVKGLPREQQPMAMMGTLMGVGPALLEADPGFAIERFNLRGPDGEIDGRFRMQSVGLRWSEIGDTRTVLEKIDAEAALRMPESYFRELFAQQAQARLTQELLLRGQAGEESEAPSEEQLQALAQAAAGAQIDSLLSQEVLVRDGETLVTAATLSSGLLSVNGKVIPLPFFEK